MKYILNKIILIFDKMPIIKYILISFIKSFIVASVLAALVYFALQITGIYSKLETMLDLKYNSPMIVVPMWAFVALCVLCFVIGFLMYFHKYKRGKYKTVFFNTLAPKLEKNKKN